jgi:hypothetical protein
MWVLELQKEVKPRGSDIERQFTVMLMKMNFSATVLGYKS